MKDNVSVVDHVGFFKIRVQHDGNIGIGLSRYGLVLSSKNTFMCHQWRVFEVAQLCAVSEQVSSPVDYANKLVDFCKQWGAVSCDLYLSLNGTKYFIGITVSKSRYVEVES